MKKTGLLILSTLFFVSAITPSCKRCKECHATIMGVESPKREICGDELEQAEKTPSMTCE